MTTRSKLVIDFHAHFLLAEVVEQTASKNVITGFGAQPLAGKDTRHGQVFAKMLDPSTHLEDMDRLGIDMEVLLSTTVIESSSWAPPAQDLALNALVNDAIGAWVERHPDRFIGSCTLPLQDLTLAIPELERAARELGARVVQIPAHVQGRYVGHPSLWPCWEAVRDLDLVVFLHPEGISDRWFQDYYLWNSVGQPIEEAKALSSIIYEGLLEQMPELKIVVAHGGGFLPHYFGRIDRNVQNMPSSARNISRPPGSYLQQLFYDTCVYDPFILQTLVTRFGADRMVMGADYPVGEADPVDFVQSNLDLPPAARSAALGGTAQQLLRLETAATAPPT
jgi:aminocarboxymuconate-semialdehyde decarboxylase